MPAGPSAPQPSGGDLNFPRNAPSALSRLRAPVPGQAIHRLRLCTPRHCSAAWVTLPHAAAVRPHVTSPGDAPRPTSHSGSNSDSYAFSLLCTPFIRCLLHRFLFFSYSFTGVNVFPCIVYLSGSTSTSVEALIVTTYVWTYTCGWKGSIARKF